MYYIVLYTFEGNRKSLTSELHIYTAPIAPDHFSLIALRDNTIKVQWKNGPYQAEFESIL